ncbi:MAG: acetate/propionate family kinase [Verrucomicrobiota bacterium]|nr:acetate/propionate family kinase [Verrucomicrobiota bacterium]
METVSIPEPKIALTINNGSSSSKFSLIMEGNADPMISINCANIGRKDSVISYKIAGEKNSVTVLLKDHKTAMKKAWELIKKNFPNINITAVGHRIVHGGPSFKESVLIETEVEKEIERCSPLAPLHNPANLSGYRVARELFPNTPHVAIFDTAFHAKMPEYAKRYAIPEKWYTEDMVAKYGFHGTSFQYVSRKFGALKGIYHEDLNLVVGHFGNGASIAKVERGISTDTTMGLTPLDGCVMGTRAGSIDPGIIDYIADIHKITASEVIKILNNKSGLLALFGDTNMMKVREKYHEGDRRAALTMDISAYRAAKFFASYLSTMENPRGIVFTAGIGENETVFRKRVLNFLKFYEWHIDVEANMKRDCNICIAKGMKRMEAWVIPTNEELILGEDSISIATTGHVPKLYSFERI